MSTDDILTERLHRAEEADRRTETMSETTKVDDAFYQLTLSQRDGAWRGLDALRIERDALAAQLTEVTRKLTAARADIKARKTADQILEAEETETSRVWDHLRYQSWRDVKGIGEILAFDYDTMPDVAKREAVKLARQAADRLYNVLKTAAKTPSQSEAALAPLRAVVEAAKGLVGKDGARPGNLRVPHVGPRTQEVPEAAWVALRDAIAALPADPSAPTPEKEYTAQP